MILRRAGSAVARGAAGGDALGPGAVLIADEIKTIGRLALGGACERFGVRPDLVVMGKAIANGFPLAAVGGRADLMAGVRSYLDLLHARHRVRLARRGPRDARA